MLKRMIAILVLAACLLICGCSGDPQDVSDESSAESVETSDPSSDPSSEASSEPELKPYVYRPVSLISADSAVIYTYNEYGELARTDRADGSYTVHTYTGDGHPLNSVTYDSSGKESGRVTREYNDKGQLIKANGPRASIIYEYGSDGRIAKTVENGVAKRYDYSDDGGYTVSYTVDGVDTVCVYDENGNELRIEENGVLRSESIYNGLGLRTDVKIYADGAPSSEIRSSYDSEGRITESDYTSFADGSGYKLLYVRGETGINIDRVDADGNATLYARMECEWLEVKVDPYRYDSMADDTEMRILCGSGVVYKDPATIPITDPYLG